MRLITVKRAHRQVPARHALRPAPAAADAPARVNPVKLFFFYWLPVILYAGIIFLFSSQDGRGIPALFLGQDVIFHIVEYTGFAYLIYRLIKQCRPLRKPGQALALVLLVIFIYALTDEYHQSFVPGRTAEIFDVAMDCLGGLLAGAFYR